MLKKALITIFVILFNLSFVYGQNKFNSLCVYSIKGVLVGNTQVCELNGFNYGIIDYGIYKDTAFYFVVNFDCVQFGQKTIMFKSVSHEITDVKGVKKIKYALVESSNPDQKIIEAMFWKGNDSFSYFVLENVNPNTKDPLIFVLVPKNS